MYTKYNMFAVHIYVHVPWSLPYCDVHTVLCVGASADIADYDGKTPLQWAQKKKAETFTPEQKQSFEKVD